MLEALSPAAIEIDPPEIADPEAMLMPPADPNPASPVCAVKRPLFPETLSPVRIEASPEDAPALPAAAALVSVTLPLVPTEV